MTEDEFRGHIERATQLGALNALDAVAQMIGELRGRLVGETGQETHETGPRSAERPDSASVEVRNPAGLSEAQSESVEIQPWRDGESE